MRLASRLTLIAAWALAFALFVQNSSAWAATLSISPSGARESLPATDLIDPRAHELADPNEALEQRNQGEDLSLWDPEPTDLWQSPEGPRPLPTPASFPRSDAQGAWDAEYESSLSSPSGLIRAKIRALPNEGGLPRSYHLTLSLLSHGAMTRAALLKRVGYQLPEIRWNSKLRLKFRSKAERDGFLDSLSDSTLTARTRWLYAPLEQMPENEAWLQDAVLEPAQVDAPRVHWGILPAAAVGNRRALRSLILPLSLLDIPESVNGLSWEFAKKVGESLWLTHPYAESFQAATWDDLRWLARKLARLTQADWDAAIDAGAWPRDVAALLKEKLASRRNQLVTLLQVKDETRSSGLDWRVDRKLSFGAVKDGQLTQSQYEGYACRFSMGAPPSPIRPSEIFRYLAIDLLSEGVGALLELINTHLLTGQGPGDVIAKRQADAVEEALKAAKDGSAPKSIPIKAWAGPTFGGSIQASRSVNTGTYYGSDSKVQLVDALGFSASIGFMGGIEGVQTIIPTFSANLFLQRSYVHLRPISEMKKGLKDNWLNLWVPRFFKNFEKILGKSGDAGVSESAQATAVLGELADQMEEGETFIIGDSVGVSAGAGFAIPLPLLLDAGIGVFSPSIGVSLATQPALLRRIVITRTSTGFQVTLQDSKSISLQVGANLNWVVRLASLSAIAKTGVADSSVFTFDLNRMDSERQPALVRALRAIFKKNNSEILENEFPYFHLHHSTQARINLSRLLLWQWTSLEETHRLTVSPPGHPEAERSLMSHRLWKSGGINSTPLLSDLTTVLTQGLVHLSESSDLNPASSFLGSGSWRVVRSEMETTGLPKAQLSLLNAPLPSPSPSRGITGFIENHWGGWYLSKKELGKVFDAIEKHTRGYDLDRSVIHREVFEDLKYLQLYDISATTVVYEEGVKKIYDTLMKTDRMREVFEKLVDIDGRDAFKAWCRTPWHAVLAHTLLIDNYVGFDFDGTPVRIKCVRPWMKAVLGVRSRLAATRFSQKPEHQLRLATQLLAGLNNSIEFPTLARWVGRENVFFQVRVSGFRTHDENGDLEYLSDALGTPRPRGGSGPFAELASRFGISASEIHGRYLSDGY